MEDLDDALCASDEGEPLVQAHPGYFEGRQAQRSGELERAVAEQGIGNVLALCELELLGGRLCAHADDGSVVSGEVADVIAEGAALWGASTRTGYLIPTLGQRLPGPARARVDIDNKQPAGGFAEIDLSAERGRQAQARDIETGDRRRRRGGLADSPVAHCPRIDYPSTSHPQRVWARPASGWAAGQRQLRDAAAALTRGVRERAWRWRRDCSAGAGVDGPRAPPRCARPGVAP